MEEIERKRKEWMENTLKKFLQKVPERKEKFLTTSGIEIKEIYDPTDLKDWNFIEKLGYPGEYPFTRGVYATMYRGKLWTMRQYAGFGTAEETNKRYKFLLSHGQTGLSVAFDLPTQMGYDSDHPMALGEVGKVGVAVDTIEDMRILFDGIPLDKVSTSMTINATASILLTMYQIVGEENGVSSLQLRGTVQNDILKEYIARGTYIFPPEPSMRLVADTILYCSKFIPKWNSISISGYHIREAGANAVQEVAFTIANGIAYVEKVLERGVDVDVFAPRLSFFFASHNNFFEEIAKFRAARRVWAKVMKDRFGAENPRSMMLRFHAQTAGSTLTAQQPLNNIIRVTIQALAAVLGGAQSLHTNSYDEALALPTEKSVEIALRTQQIIAYESGIADTPDPLGGSYYIEYLTDEIEERVWKYLDRIDSMGGMIKAIESGYIQREISDASYKQHKMIESGETVVVGVNKFVKDEKINIELHRVEDYVAEKQIERLKRFRENRNKKEVENALDILRKYADREECNENNIVPWIYNAIKCNATLGEIVSALKDIFGEYRAPTII